jgi:hypothetical protein
MTTIFCVLVATEVVVIGAIHGGLHKRVVDYS